MTAKRVTATEFARNLSTMLNEVRYRDAALEIWRGKECVARLLPPVRSAGLPIERLGEVLASLPRLDAEDAARFEQDLVAIDRTLSDPESPWD